MKSRLADKVVIITDGETAIGADMARSFADQGARVILQGSYDQLASSVVHAICSDGGEALVYQGDLAQEAHALNCIQMAIDHFGRLDALVTNVEAHPSLMLTEGNPLIDAERTQQTLKSIFLMAHYAMPYLRQSCGCVLGVYSEIHTVGFLHNAAHEIAIKHWLNGFMQGIAREQSDAGVRANFICSRFPQGAWPVGSVDEQCQSTGAIASDLSINPRDVVGLSTFLTSDDASYVSGAIYPVNEDRAATSSQFLVPMHYSDRALVTSGVRHPMTSRDA